MAKSTNAVKKIIEIHGDKLTKALAHILKSHNSKDLFNSYTSVLKKKNEYVSDVHSIVSLFCDADPTPNSIYTNWIMNKFAKNEFNELEDVMKLTDSLSFFTKLKPKIDVEMRDINVFKNVDSFYEFVEEHYDVDVTSNNKKDEIYENMLINTKSAEIIYNDDQIKIIVPHTVEASIWFGKNTRWCTAAKNNNYFNHYYQQGYLYIVLFKKENKRWQLHFQTSQYMNEKDKKIKNEVLYDFMSNLPVDAINAFCEHNSNQKNYNDFVYVYSEFRKKKNPLSEQEIMAFIDIDVNAFLYHKITDNIKNKVFSVLNVTNINDENQIFEAAKITPHFLYFVKNFSYSLQKKLLEIYDFKILALYINNFHFDFIYEQCKKEKSLSTVFSKHGFYNHFLKTRTNYYNMIKNLKNEEKEKLIDIDPESACRYYFNDRINIEYISEKYPLVAAQNGEMKNMTSERKELFLKKYPFFVVFENIDHDYLTQNECKLDSYIDKIFNDGLKIDELYKLGDSKEIDNVVYGRAWSFGVIISRYKNKIDKKTLERISTEFIEFLSNYKGDRYAFNETIKTLSSFVSKNKILELTNNKIDAIDVTQISAHDLIDIINYNSSIWIETKTFDENIMKIFSKISVDNIRLLCYTFKEQYPSVLISAIKMHPYTFITYYADELFEHNDLEYVRLLRTYINGIKYMSYFISNKYSKKIMPLNDFESAIAPFLFSSDDNMLYKFHNKYNFETTDTKMIVFDDILNECGNITKEIKKKLLDKYKNDPEKLMDVLF